ncbi:MAG: DUF721 domain-containing protein [Bacteroidota bacterium]
MSKQRPSSRKSEEQELKLVLQKMLEVYKIKGKLNQSRVKTLWSEMMGPAINKHTTEIKVFRERLYVTIDSAPLRQELSYGRDKILRNLNKELGETYLKEVVIR